jgi:hypothetical protein
VDLRHRYELEAPGDVSADTAAILLDPFACVTDVKRDVQRGIGPAADAAGAPEKGLNETGDLSPRRNFESG